MIDDKTMEMTEFIKKYEEVRRYVKQQLGRVHPKNFRTFSQEKLKSLFSVDLQKQVKNNGFDEVACQCVLNNFEDIYNDFMQTKCELDEVKQDFDKKMEGCIESYERKITDMNKFTYLQMKNQKRTEIQVPPVFGNRKPNTNNIIGEAR